MPSADHDRRDRDAARRVARSRRLASAMDGKGGRGALRAAVSRAQFRAQEVHRAHHAPNAVQLSTLISIKTGGCPEDCGYCRRQRYIRRVAEQALLDSTRSLRPPAPRGRRATRFCMGAAWRAPKERDLEPVLAMVRGVKALGLRDLLHARDVNEGQPKDQGRRPRLLQPHLDTAPEFYGEVITTRDYQDRLDTLDRSGRRASESAARHRRHGESTEQRAGLLAQLASLDRIPNRCHQPSGAGGGTPLHDRLGGEVRRPVRIRAHRRRGANHDAEGDGAPFRGRRELGEAVQALCFLAGANSIFYATSCSRPAIRKSTPTARCSQSSG